MGSVSEDAPAGGEGVLGDFDSPDKRLTRMAARDRFLEAVVRLEPTVIETLADAPYAAYVPLRDDLEATGDGGFHGHADFWRWPLGPSVPSPLDMSCTAPLQEALLAWGQRWRLADDWCFSIALNALSCWWVYRLPPRQPLPEDFARFHWSDWLPSVIDPMERWRSEHGFIFSYQPWEPTEMPRAMARKAMRAAFEAHLTEYLDQMEQLARTRGFVRTTDKVSRHFEWLALYQVGERSPAQIARICGKERAAVDAAIRATAALLELSLRPCPRGGVRHAPHRGARTIVLPRR